MLPDDTRIPDALDIADEQMALAGINSAIPVDEVIDAMRRIGARHVRYTEGDCAWRPCNHSHGA